MKVLHVAYSYDPDPVGGTEVYVDALATRLRTFSVSSVVAAPAAHSSTYSHNGYPVERFGISAAQALEEIYGEGDAEAARRFADILARHQPDLLHLHAFTGAVSPLLIDAADARGVTTVFTYHTPTATCAVGTLVRYHHQVCDGEMRAHRCASCLLNDHGIARPASDLVAAIPAKFGGLASRIGRGGRLSTAVKSRGLIEIRHRASRRLLDAVARVIVPCEWARQTLLRNKIPEEKLVLSRQGLTTPLEASRARIKSTDERVLRLAFFGRFDRTKGPDLAIRAVRASNEASIRLDLYGVVADETAFAYAQELRRLAGDDTRIRFLAPVPSREVARTMARYEAVVVPSRVLETGPLVVYEAFAAGIPVIGSRRGGIAELVRDSVDGLLVEPDSVSAWRAAIEHLLNHSDILPRLRASVRPPRTMHEVAEEMASVYASVLSSERSKARRDLLAVEEVS